MSKRKHEAIVTSKYFGSGTSSFFKTSAQRKGSFPPLIGSSPPHTLICGTQASDNALDGDVPFFTNENAFWHILGDALGFRRGFHHRREDAVDSIRPHLLHPIEAELGYDEARRRLLDAGYCVWDIVGESERAGSLDQDIKNPRFHDIRALCRQHPSIERICFATGQGSAKIFRGAWKKWLATPGAFTVASDAGSQAVFAKYIAAAAAADDAPPAADSASTSLVVAHLEAHHQVVDDSTRRRPIELIVMESVSPAAVPAAATYSKSKRIAAYKAAGRLDLVAAGAPRASAYAWKRSCWLASTAFPEGVLHPRAKEARVFGAIKSDLLIEEEEEEAQIVD